MSRKVNKMPDQPLHTKDKKNGESQQQSKSHSTRMRRDFFKEVGKPSTFNETETPKGLSKKKTVGKIGWKHAYSERMQEIVPQSSQAKSTNPPKNVKKLYEINIIDLLDEINIVDLLDEIKVLKPEVKKKIRLCIADYPEVKNVDESFITAILIYIIMIILLVIFNNSLPQILINIENNVLLIFPFILIAYLFIIIAQSIGKFIAIFIGQFIYRVFHKPPSFFEEITPHIIHNLLKIIWLAEEDSGHSTETQKRKYQIFLLEKTAQSIEKDLPRILRGGDIATDTWVKETMKQVGTALREKKKSLLIPKKESSTSFINDIASTLNHIADGSWGDLEKIEPVKLTRSELRSSFLNFLSKMLKAILIGAIPLMGFLVFEQTQFALTGTIFTSAVTILILFEISVFTSTLDPNFGDHISRVKDIQGLIPSR
jgi:hypothetical protein